MSPGLKTVDLTIEHMRNAGERMPVGSMHVSESPLDPVESETFGDPWILANILVVIVIDELMSEGLTENDPDDRDKKDTDAGDEDALIAKPSVGAG